jgi:hypothetical protein
VLGCIQAVNKILRHFAFLELLDDMCANSVPPEVVLNPSPQPLAELHLGHLEHDDKALPEDGGDDERLIHYAEKLPVKTNKQMLVQLKGVFPMDEAIIESNEPRYCIASDSELTTFIYLFQKGAHSCPLSSSEPVLEL